MMEQRRFGDTDLVSSALGFGTWEMSTTEYGHIDVDEASAAVGAAIDNGITLFDTAEAYGPYHSEEILGCALGARRKEVVLVTKVGFKVDGTPARDSTREWVLARTEGCLQRLNTDWIDLLLIHWPDHDTPFAETMGALEELKTAGKIRHYGVSNFTVEMMEECERHGHLATNQVGYHLFDRRMEAQVLPYCLEQGIGFMAYGTLGFGLLTGAFTPDTTFEEGDWRSAGDAFNLPLFEQGALSQGAALYRAIENARRARWEVRGATGYRVGAGPPCAVGGAGRHTQPVGTRGERGCCRLEAYGRRAGRDRPHLCRGGRADLRRCAPGGIEKRRSAHAPAVAGCTPATRLSPQSGLREKPGRPLGF